MKPIYYFILSAILVCFGCTDTDETERLIGDWKGEQIFITRSDGSIEGYLQFNYRISKDSITVLHDNPLFDKSVVHSMTNDSLHYVMDDLKFSCKWYLQDTLLSLVVFFEDEKDSLTFSKIDFK